MNPAQTYWTLQFNQHAVNLSLTAPYNTIRLTAIPRTAAGDSLRGLGPVTYIAHDSTVSVDSAGVVIAHDVTTQTFIVATLQDPQQRITHQDTVFIQVTDTIPNSPLDTFSVQPAPGDSAKRSVDFVIVYFPGFPGGPGGFFWPAHATDAAGHTLCDVNSCALQVYYTSSNPEVATIDRMTGQVTAYMPGKVVLTATTWAYGVSTRDSLTFTIGHRLLYLNIIGLVQKARGVTAQFTAPQTISLSVGGVMLFKCAADNSCSSPVDVVFDHQTAIDSASYLYLFSTDIPQTGGGNIPAFGGDSAYNSEEGTPNADVYRARRFTAPGLYRYHSSVFPSDTLSILVQKDE
jgi:hypothetical protein